MSADLIKELRAKTGVGFMACKKALAESGNDLNAAIEYLRKASGIKADGKAHRATSEGVIACLIDESMGRGVLLEINCETDFVARSEDFEAFVDRLAAKVLQVSGNGAHDGANDPFKDPQVEQERAEMVQRIGENIQLTRWRSLSGGPGCQMGYYLHNNKSLGALVSLVGGDSELAKSIAMHIVAVNPPFVAPEDVPAEVLEREGDIYREQALQDGKPPEIVDKVVAGRLKKFTAEVSLLEQDFVRDPDQKIGDMLSRAKASVGGFLRFQLGESLDD